MRTDRTDRRVAERRNSAPAKEFGDIEESDRSQIVQRLSWTPKERLDYLLDMLAFEELAHRARRL